MNPQARAHNQDSDDTLHGISSMATRALLAQLLSDYAATGGSTVNMLSIGGVDALKRLQGGEAFDVAVLASVAIAKLVTSGHAHADSVTALLHSGVALAVQTVQTNQGGQSPRFTVDLSTEASVKAAVLAAPSISYSTGPSGVALAQLFERWGIAQQVAARTITPPPGTPVASLVGFVAFCCELFDFLPPDFIDRFTELLGDVESVEHVERGGQHGGDDVQIGFPQVGTDDLYFSASLSSEGLEEAGE